MQQQIYFWNIQMKHMQHTSKIHKTYGCNMCSSTCCPPMEARWCEAQRQRGSSRSPAVDKHMDHSRGRRCWGRRVGPIQKRTDVLRVSLSKHERQERENKHHNNNTENNHHQQLQRETTKLQLPWKYVNRAWHHGDIIKLGRRGRLWTCGGSVEEGSSVGYEDERPVVEVVVALR